MSNPPEKPTNEPIQFTRHWLRRNNQRNSRQRQPKTSPVKSKKPERTPPNGNDAA